MKRVISLVLALVMVCGLAFTALAADFDMSVDADVLQAGETVTATIALDEAVVGAAQVQIELYYDPEVLTCTSKTLASGFEFLSIVDYENFVGFNWLDMTFKGQDLAAGTVATVTFTANEIVDVADLELTIEATYGDITGAMNILDPVTVELTVCPGHQYYSYTTEGTCLDPVSVIYECMNCGHSYPGESEGVYGEHDLEYVFATYTCTESGLKEHYECLVCGKYFEDWSCEVELSEEDLYAPAAHIPETLEAWMDDGTVVETSVCAICEEVLGESITVYPLWAEDCPTTINVAAGETAYYNANGFGGYSILIYGENISVAVPYFDRITGESGVTTYVPENGVTTIPVEMYQARLQITNLGASDAAYEIDVYVPLGDWMNPDSLYDGENSFDIAADNYYGYTTNYIPFCNGTVTVTVDGEYWSYVVNHGSEYGYEHCFNDDVVVNSETIEVEAGVPVEVVLANYYVDENWEWHYPAGTITVDVEFVPAHNVVHVDAKAPSCFEEGNVEYWYCDVCGAAWLDADCTMVTNLMSVKLAPWCQDVVHMEAVDPACHYTGNVEYWYCTNPEHGTVWTDEDRTQVSNHLSVVLPALGGDVVHVEAVKADCFGEGNIEYWYCEECEQVWQDEALTQLTNIKNVILPTTEHNIVHMEAVAPACHYEGHVEHWYCTNCETVWADAELKQITNHLNVILPELGGDVVHVEAKAPSCYEEGNIEYWYCEECEQVWQNEALTQLTNIKNVVLPASHNNIVHMEAVAPACHYEGHVEHWYCVDCDTVWVDEDLMQISNHLNVILPELGGEVEHVEAAEADCRNPGHIEYWYCEECEQVWQDEALTQLTNRKNVITEAALGFVDEDKDGICDICGTNNPHTGDVTIIVAAAAAVISATGIVALPIAKKKFF